MTHYDPIRAHRWFGVPDRYEFAPNRNADYVNVFDLAARRCVKRIQVANQPDVTATTADGRFLYVAGDALCIVDLETLGVVRTLSGGPISSHYAVNLFPDGRYMWLYTYDGAMLVLRDADDPARVAVEQVIRVNAPAAPDSAVGGKGHFTSDGRRYINANWHTHIVFEIALDEGYEVRSLVAAGFDKPDDLVMPPGEHKGYAASYGSGRDARGAVHVFDPVLGRVVKEIRVGRHPAGLTMSPDGRTAYVTNVADGSVSAIDVETDDVLFTLDAAPAYRAAGITGDYLDIEGVTTSADGRTLYAYAVNYGALVIFDDLGGRNQPTFLRGDPPL